MPYLGQELDAPEDGTYGPKDIRRQRDAGLWGHLGQGWMMTGDGNVEREGSGERIIRRKLLKLSKGLQAERIRPSV